ncbi:uncharacterized protein P174DRAFT_431927 [Aspergillus novofumigatus IBT 16806]|uniref:Uncharacterized protein n=1 Tax=Aspergillus novofumigatus (strain IBT 16806) TaxID=1392255 RepID=A0A2I1C4H9_ASPN1|nr:uncharacterized protein P174DRAFT_431927 [Aspergillus novofumigatus IBT 16806]PKX92534.1 hypothetical protein P174DRAFT_431927 [Aspergillus novofumigatus IBT 16806]
MPRSDIFPMSSSESPGSSPHHAPSQTPQTDHPKTQDKPHPPAPASPHPSADPPSAPTPPPSRLGLRITRLQTHPLRQLGLPFREVRPPRIVACFCGRVRVARHLPAFEVLGADGDLEGLGRVGGAFVEVGGHFVGVVQLVGDCVIAVAVAVVGDGDAAGILGVGFVDEGEGFGEFVAGVVVAMVGAFTIVARDDGLACNGM